MAKRICIFFLVLALGVLIAVTIGWRESFDFSRVVPLAVKPSEEDSFRDWLAASPSRLVQFEEFTTYLQNHGVGDVVEVWQLAKVSSAYARRCDLEPFQIPPEELWPKIVGPLQLVRDHVKPVVGEVEVKSSYRPPAVNTCARGAGRSKHLTFAALYLTPIDGSQGAALFGKLCDIHKTAGRRSRMGLGAYYDPARSEERQARFHIDASGYRTWGFDYSNRSSPCIR